MREVLNLFSNNCPDLANYWNCDDNRKREANTVYDNVEHSMRKHYFGLENALVLSVCKGVFAYSALMCKPVEFVGFEHPGFQKAFQNGTQTCQKVNSHLSQRFKGRYVLHRIHGFRKAMFLSGWFRTSGREKSHFCVGPGNIVMLGPCIARGRDCLDRIQHNGSATIGLQALRLE